VAEKKGIPECGSKGLEGKKWAIMMFGGDVKAKLKKS
jgi:hypothetical protein